MTEIAQTAPEESPPKPRGGSPPDERQGFLDAVRGLAALLVAISHAVPVALNDDTYRRELFYALGHVGVAAFFVCSGYVIPLSLERSKSIRQFWIRRFFRLYPLYWIVLGIILLIGRFVQLPEVLRLHQAERFADLAAHPVRSVIGNLSMISEPLGVRPWINVAWTLWIELAFYILATIFHALGWIRRPDLLTWAAIAAMVGVRMIPGFHSYEISNLTFCLAVMWSGTILHRLVEGKGPKLSSIAAIATLYLYFATRHFPGWLVGHVLFLVAMGLRRFAVPSSLRLLGVVSYSIYLLHIPILMTVPGVGPAWFKVAVWMLLTVALSVATFRFIERPAITLGRKLSGSRGNPGQAMAP